MLLLYQLIQMTGTKRIETPSSKHNILRAYLDQFCEDNGVDVFEQWNFVSVYYSDREQSCRCSHPGIKWINTIKNIYNGIEVDQIGSVCIDNFFCMKVKKDMREAIKKIERSRQIQNGKVECLVKGCTCLGDDKYYHFCKRHETQCMNALVSTTWYKGKERKWCDVFKMDRKHAKTYVERIQHTQKNRYEMAMLMNELLNKV